MKTRSLILVAAVAAMVAGCGGGDDPEPAAERAAGDAFVGIYTQEVDKKAARKIPDESMAADTYRLVLEADGYQLHAERGPFGGGSLEAREEELRFGPNADGGCDATGVYRAVRSGDELQLIAKQDPCQARKALWTLGRWTTAQ